MLSKTQKQLYWREWSAVAKALQAAGKPATSEDRHNLHSQALGKDKSMTDFTNTDLDKVLGEFRAITRPDDLSGQISQAKQSRKRKLYVILQQMPERLAKVITIPEGVHPNLAAENYIAKILQDRFKVADPLHLTDDQLTQLLATLNQRLKGNGSKYQTSSRNYR